MQYYVITAVGIMVKENNDLNDLFEAYKAEENPIKRTVARHVQQCLATETKRGD